MRGLPKTVNIWRQGLLGPIFHGGSESKASTFSAGDWGSIPGSRRSLEKELATHSRILIWETLWTEEPGGLLSMGSQRVGHNWATSMYTLEKAVAPHSSTLAWKIPWTEEPGGLQSMGSLRVRHDWATSLSLFNFMHWRRQWQPTPVFLPGESQGWGSLVGCRLWGHTESDTTEVT